MHGKVGLDCRIKANYLLVGPGPVGGVPPRESLSKGSQPVFKRVPEKTTENFERLSRPGIEPGTSRLPVLIAEPLCHHACAGKFTLLAVFFVSILIK